MRSNTLTRVSNNPGAVHREYSSGQPRLFRVTESNIPESPKPLFLKG